MTAADIREAIAKHREKRPDPIKATDPAKQGTIASEIRAWRKVRAAIAMLAYGGKHSSLKMEQMTKGQADAY